MFEQLPLFPETASTLAPRVDALYFFLVAVSGFFTILIAALIVIFAAKYRRRSTEDVGEPMGGGLVLEAIWIGVPLLLAMVMFAWGASVFFSWARPPAGAMDIYVVGKQWMWKVQHMDGQREINQLHVPVGRPVRLTMGSQDVIHSFYIPAFRVKADVVPGRWTTLWFEATRPGRYHLFCAEYCGTKHSAMIGEVVALEPADFQAWLAGGEGAGSLASLGQRLFQDLACDTCHRADAQGRGPMLDNLFGATVELSTGETIVADENYIRESILAPTARVVAGFEPLMPAYQGLVTEEQLLQLVAYIRSLAPEGPDQAPTGEERREPAAVQPPR